MKVLIIAYLYSLMKSYTSILIKRFVPNKMLRIHSHQYFYLIFLSNDLSCKSNFFKVVFCGFKRQRFQIALLATQHLLFENFEIITHKRLDFF